MLVPEGLFSIVALVLAIGGLFKLRDPGPTRRMLDTLGLPAPDVATHVLGALEVAVGLTAFLFGGTVLAAAVAVLYFGFALVIVVLVRKGDDASSCGCFGRLSSRPSVVHTAIDGLAAIIASASAVAAVPGIVDYARDLPFGGLAQICMVVGGSWLLIVAMTSLPRRLDDIRRSRRDDARLIRAPQSDSRSTWGDSHAFDVAGASPHGDELVVDVSGTTRATLLVFLSSGCSTCARFWNALAGGEADQLVETGTRVVVVTKGPGSENPDAVRARAPAGMSTVMSDSAFTDYRVPGSPYFVLVDGASGRVAGEGTAESWAQVAELLAGLEPRER